MARFCRKCGTGVPDGQMACPQCGGQNLVAPGGGPANSTPQPVQQTAAPAPMPAQGMAQRPGPVITGGSSARGASAPEGSNAKWFAIGGGGLVVIIIIAALLVPRVTKHPILFNSKDPKHSQTCMENQHLLSLALNMYQQDYEGNYPSANGDWGKVLLYYYGEETGKKGNFFNCPISSKAGSSSDPDYAVNASILGTSDYTLKDPANTLLVADDAGGSHLLRSVADIATTAHRGPDRQTGKVIDGVILTTVDGAAHICPVAELSSDTLTVERKPYTPSPGFSLPPH